MSLWKYIDHPGGADHGGQLAWARSGDLPPLRKFNGSALTQAEVDAVEEMYDFHGRTFKLWDPQDLKDYNEIRDRCSNGWYQVVARSEQYVPEQLDWVVKLEWVQIYGEIPDGKMPGQHERSPAAPPIVDMLQGSRIGL